MKAWIQYTDKVPAADSKFFRIRINPKHKNDVGLLAHEMEHVRHWYGITASSIVVSCILSMIFFPALLTHIFTIGLLVGYSSMVYNLATTVSKKARLRAESMCYAKQLDCYLVEGRERYELYFAKVLATEYDLNISEEEALRSIKRHMKV